MFAANNSYSLYSLRIKPFCLGNSVFNMTELPMPVRRGLEKVHPLDNTHGVCEKPLNANPCYVWK